MLRHIQKAFVSGHLDLTDDEFKEHYEPEIRRVLDENGLIFVGDARGADAMTQKFVASLGKVSQLRVFHMFTSPRNIVEGAMTFHGFESDLMRDESLTAHTEFDIAWVRPGREKSGTQKNLDRRNRAKDKQQRRHPVTVEVAGAAPVGSAKQAEAK